MGNTALALIPSDAGPPRQPSNVFPKFFISIYSYCSPLKCVDAVPTASIMTNTEVLYMVFSGLFLSSFFGCE